jgi:hypothetical protein
LFRDLPHRGWHTGIDRRQSQHFPAIGLPHSTQRDISPPNFASEENTRGRAENLRDFVARKNFAEFGRFLFEQSERPRVLIVGGAEIGAGLRELLESAD